MQSVLSRFWTRVAMSISYDDNHYTTGTFIIMKTKHSIHILIFGDGDVRFLFNFPRVIRLNTKSYIKCSDEVMLAWIERVASGSWTLRHVTQEGEPNVGWENISANKSPLTSGRLPPQMATPQDYYVWGAVERETNQTVQ